MIDITATAPGRRPATDAVRVERDMRVQVPALVGQRADDAAAATSRSSDLKAARGARAAAGSTACSAARCASARRARRPGTLVDPSTTVTLATAPSGCLVGSATIIVIRGRPFSRITVQVIVPVVAAGVR